MDVVELMLRLKIRLGPLAVHTDELLLELIDEATAEILAECNLTELPEELDNTVIQWAIIKYNRQGSEGFQNENYFGTATGYVNDFPESIKRQLNRFRKARGKGRVSS